jgi:hypothetical protein
MYQQKDWTISRKVSFDLSGQILLYEEQEKTLWGTKKTTTNQMVRLETSDK